MIDLSQYEAKEHPFKAVFKKHGIKNIILANYLGAYPQNVCAMLNGQQRMTKPVEAKLQALIDQLENDNRKEND